MRLGGKLPVLNHVIVTLDKFLVCGIKLFPGCRSICCKFAADGLEIEHFLHFKEILNFISVATNLKE